MKRIALLTMVFFSLILTADAKPSASLPSPGATPFPQATPSFPRGRNPQTTLIQIPAIGGPEGTASNGWALRQIVLQKYVQDLYRRPTSKELDAIAPSARIENRYRDFLAIHNSGIFRLVSDHKCSGSAKVVSAADECIKYTMPGSGSSYSFRIGSYRIPDLADLNYSADMLRISGMMVQGMMVDLGDVPIEDIDLRSDGLKYIVDFQPVTEFEKAKSIDDEIVGGIRQDVFLYRRSLPARVNSTYAMRVIAYRGKLLRSIHGISYNELDFDKRRDLIVAFRIVDRDADGSLTIIWSELSNADAPKLRSPVQSGVMLNSDLAEKKP